MKNAQKALLVSMKNFSYLKLQGYCNSVLCLLSESLKHLQPESRVPRCCDTRIAKNFHGTLIFVQIWLRISVAQEYTFTHCHRKLCYCGKWEKVVGCVGPRERWIKWIYYGTGSNGNLLLVSALAMINDDRCTVDGDDWDTSTKWRTDAGRLKCAEPCALIMLYRPRTKKHFTKIPNSFMI